MSIKASDAVWEHSRMTGSARLVMLAIASFADANDRAWPGVERLAEMVGVTTRSVQRAIQQCEQAGELAVERNAGRGHTNVYRILLLEKGDACVTNTAEEKVTPVTEKVTSATEKVTPATEKGDASVTRSVIEPSENHQRTATTTQAARPASGNGRGGGYPGRDVDEEYRQVVAAYEREIGLITEHLSRKIAEALVEFNAPLLVEAIGIAAEANKRSWRYVNGILTRWREEGRGASLPKPEKAAVRMILPDYLANGEGKLDARPN